MRWDSVEVGGVLDADAELYVVVVVTGVGVEVVGGAALEFVAAAEFAAGDEAEAEGAGTGGDPAQGDEEGVRLRVSGGERFQQAGGKFLSRLPKTRSFRTDLMKRMIAQWRGRMASAGGARFR